MISIIMKLSDYAKKIGVSYKTAWRWHQKNQINGYQAASGTIIVTEGDDKAKPQKVAIHTRFSSSENRPNLQSQVKRLTNDCIAKAWQVHKIVTDESYTVIVIEHKDRLTRLVSTTFKL